MSDEKPDKKVVICTLRKRLKRPTSLQIGERINLSPEEAKMWEKAGAVVVLTKPISRDAIRGAKGVDAYLKANPKDRADGVTESRTKELEAKLGGPPKPRKRKKQDF